MKIRTLLFFILLNLCCFYGYSQQVKDTVIIADNSSKYIGLTCILREDLMHFIIKDDTAAIEKLRNATIVYHLTDEQKIKARLLTARENQMLRFYFGEHDKLLSEIRTRDDYFLQSKSTQKGYSDPNFECGNMTLGMLEFWKSRTDRILSNIQQSTVPASEKELLTLYWEAIILYLEGEKTLSPEINKKAKEYLNKYPDTAYRSFTERLEGLKRVYQLNAMSLKFGLGKSHPARAINNYLTGNLTYDFELGYAIRNWHIKPGYRSHGFNYQDTVLLGHIDTININESSAIGYHGFALKIGYMILDKGRFKVQPFISGELNKMVNYIDNPDSARTRQIGKTHPMLGFGTEGAVRLNKNLNKDYEYGYLYYPREEKDLFYNALFLSFSVGYYPNVFSKPTSVSGDILYWTVGLEWLAGKKQVYYKHQK